MKRKLFSMLFVLVMIITVIPFSAFAENTNANQTESYGDFIGGEQVIRDMIEKNGMNAHPRIIMTDEKFAKLKKHIGDNSVTAILLEKLRGEADRIMKEPVCQYEIPDGIRLLETSKRIQRRVAALALAYNIFGDEKYAQRGYEELKAACDFQDWNPSHFLDTAEMSTGFAIGYDWLYQWMDDEQREYIRQNMIEKGFIYAVDLMSSRVFQRDQEGNLIAVIGGSGNQLGTFGTPVAVEVYGNRVYVLDRLKSSIIIFETTEYGKLVEEALLAGGMTTVDSKAVSGKTYLYKLSDVAYYKRRTFKGGNEHRRITCRIEQAFVLVFIGYVSNILVKYPCLVMSAFYHFPLGTRFRGIHITQHQ